MRVLIIIFIGLISVVSFSKNITSKNEKINEVLKKNNIKIKDIIVDHAVMEAECQGDTSDSAPNTIFRVDVRARKTLDLNGNKYLPNTILSFCDGRLAFIGAEGNLSYSFDGYECRTEIGFTKNGDLCTCRLAKDMDIEGVVLPRESRIFLKNRKFWAATVENFDKNPLYPRTGSYTIEKGQAKIYADDHHLRCLYNE